MSPLVLIPQYFGSLVFDRQESRYYPFDEAATALLDTLREAPSSEVIASHADPDAARRQVIALHELGWLRLDGTLAADRLETPAPDGHLLGPLATHVEIIATCNLRCTHCFAAPMPRGAKDPLSLAELDDLFRQLARLGSFRLGLTGGEPLLRKDFIEVVDAATAAGLHPCVTTNGFFLTDELARKLGDRRLVWLNVSLDGASAHTHDAVRGRGSFETTLERLQHLRDHARFTLAFTITRHNFREVDACVALAERVGAQTAVFRPVYPAGAALTRPELMPEFDDYQSALRSLERLCESGEAVPGRALDAFSPQARGRTAAKVTAGHGCGAANTVCSVSVDGTVSPCSFLGTRFDGASIRERPFQEIWNEGASMLTLRGEHDEAFRGGCRARSLALRGSVRARDPWEVAWREGESTRPERTLELTLA